MEPAETGDAIAADVTKALHAAPLAARAFAGLPPSHRAEYLKWIGEARRQETRLKRIAGMIARLE